MKFNKNKLVTYQTKLNLDGDDGLLYGIALRVKAFIEGVGQKIDKDGYKCDEYDILYMPYSDSRIILWFNLYQNNQGLLIIGIPTSIVKIAKPEEIQEAIEEALKEVIS